MYPLLEHPIPKLRHLPLSLPLDGAIRLELKDGIPILRASNKVQKRIVALLQKQSTTDLTQDELRELDLYEEIDDYLSFLNRVIRNQSLQ